MDEHKKLAIFDIDGTIFRSSLAIEQINQFVEDGIFPAKVLEDIQGEYYAWLDREGSYEDYIQKTIEVYGGYLRGKPVHTIQQANRRMVEKQYKRVYRYTRHLIRDLKQQGYLILAISGSPEGVVREFQQFWNIDFAYGTTFVIEDDRFTGEVLFEPAQQKKQVLRDFIEAHGISLDESIGVGDTASDMGFLEEVAQPIAFNPNKQLKALAEERGWKIVVERKDVVWEMVTSTHK